MPPAPTADTDAQQLYTKTPGTEPIPGYVLLEPLGRGGFGEVWKCEAPGGLLKAVKFVTGNTGAVTDVSWRLDSNLLASSGEDGAVRLWESQNGGQVRAWTAHGGGAASVRFTHDGRLVSTGRDKVTKVWDGNGAQQRAFEAHADLGLKVTFTHDGKRVAAGDWTGEIRLWDVADGRLVPGQELPLGAFYSVAISPDGKLLAVGCGPRGRQFSEVSSYILKMPDGSPSQASK